MSTLGVHVDLQEFGPDRYHQRCAVCGQPRTSIRVLEWRPPLGPKGVPAWSVRAAYFCAAHRAEAEHAARAAAD